MSLALRRRPRPRRRHGFRRRRGRCRRRCRRVVVVVVLCFRFVVSGVGSRLRVWLTCRPATFFGRPGPPEAGPASLRGKQADAPRVVKPGGMCTRVQKRGGGITRWVAAV